MNRRKFLKKTAGGTVFAGFSTLNLVGCAKPKAYDFIISGGMLYDGSGSPGRETDIAVRGDRIVEITPALDENKASAYFDVRGRAVAPGFIDPHSHTDVHLLINPKAESKIRQGVTTEIGGNCGYSHFPLSDQMFEERKEYLDKQWGFELTWKDVRGFFETMEAHKFSLNLAMLLGFGTMRGTVLGPYDRKPTADEFLLMKQLTRESMQAGVVGISTGLEYAPGSFSTTEELVEICREARKLGGIYATHMRSEQTEVLEAIDEAITISQEAGISLQISHLKTNYRENWDKLDQVFEKIETAQKELGHVLADRYSYHASSTGLGTLFPMWAREGTTEDVINRLKDKSLDAMLREYVGEMERKLGSWDKVLISSVPSEKNRHFQGKNVLESARETGKQCYEFIRDIVIEENNAVGMIKFGMSEDNLRKILAHPLLTIGSDGYSLAPYGPLGKGNPHPRSYGTFPRVLGKYCREEKLFPLETAVRKMTGLAAEKFKLKQRGFLREGYFADIVVFNPDTVIDTASWTDPHQYPEGIEFVMVNGQSVIRDGEHTGTLPGRMLRSNFA